MKHFVLTAILIVSQEYYPKSPHIWVEATKPVPVCVSFDDSYSNQSRVIRLMSSTIYDFLSKTLIVPPKGCYMLKPGDKLELALDQPYNAVKFNDYCLQGGCSPYSWSVLGPKESAVGEYLKPAPTPKSKLW